MRDDLKHILLETAVKRANFNGFNYNPYIAAEVRNMINRGVDSMSLSEYQSPIRRQMAQDNIVRLLDTMSYERKIRILNESIETTSFTNAKRSLCPLWPFC